MKKKLFIVMQISLFFILSFEFAFGSISILNKIPAKNTLNVLPNANIIIQFNTGIDTTTLTNYNIRVNGSQSGMHPSVFTYSSPTNTVTINPNIDFKINETIEVTITRRVKSTLNDSLAIPMVWRFTIAVSQGFLSYIKDTSIAINNPIGGILGDVDNDGDLDEIISSHDAGTITIFKNNGSGKFTLSSTLSGGGLSWGTYPPVCGDFNADGYIDIAATSRFQAITSIWFNNGNGTFSPAQQVGVSSEPDRINVADYNGDGFLDLSVRCHSGGSNNMDILINDKTGHFTKTQQYPLSSRLHCQCSGDFDGDGDIDITFATHDANLHVLFNNGNGVFSESVPVMPNIHDYLVTGDVDADGDLDLIINNPNGFAVLKNNGSGIFTKVQDLGSSGNSYYFKVLRDLDGDGDLDVIVPNGAQNREEFYFNNGSGSFSLGYTITGWCSNNAYEIDAGDLNGNGNLDLAGPDGGSFVVYRATLPLPATPTLISPSNGTIGIPLTPTLDWNDVSGALSYRAQISTDTGFTNLIFDSSGNVGSQIVIPSGKLNNNTLYYWHINASNSVGTGNWSVRWSFTTLGLPGTPLLISPSNNSTNISLTPTLVWDSVLTATNYKLQISIDSLFSLLILSDSTITQNFRIIQSGLLSYSTKYYWRVKAKNLVGSGNWSTVWNFSTLELPGIPVLVSPANNSTNISLTPTLLWNTVPSSTNYRLQLSVDSSFSTTVLSDSTLTQNYYFVQSGLLTFNTKYYWRVKAKNINGWGQNSSIWNFRTEILSNIHSYKNGIPDVFKLHNNYPNPFNPVTKIKFDIPKNSEVNIYIYDICGRELSQLINCYLIAGYYEVIWDASNFSSGVYFYGIKSKDFYDVKKTILIK